MPAGIAPDQSGSSARYPRPNAARVSGRVSAPVIVESVMVGFASPSAILRGAQRHVIVIEVETGTPGRAPAGHAWRCEAAGRPRAGRPLAALGRGRGRSRNRLPATGRVRPGGPAG